MKEIGRVLEVWCYPLSSVGGEMRETIDVSEAGVAHDRLFGLYDRATGCPAAPEQEPRWRPALNLSAVLSGGALPTVGSPDWGPFPLDHPSLTTLLTEYFGFGVGIAAHAGSVESAECLFPVVLPRYAVSPLHLLTTASLSAVATLSGLTSVDRRRFRPSVLVETNAGGFAENNWVGQTLRIGSIDVTVRERARRCGMTLAAQPGLNEEPEILRAIMRHNARTLGVYAHPIGSGSISVGDRVYAGS